MKTIQTVFISVVLMLIAVNARTQIPELIHNPAFREDAQAAVDSLYNFNGIGAEEALSEWKEKYPNHPLWRLFEGMTFWWMVLSDLENHSYDEHFFRLMKQADYAASQLLHEQSGHADALIIKAVANGYLARHNANRGEWVTSLRYARTAFKAYQYLQETLPDFADLKLAEGLKLYYAAYLPKAYPVVRTVSWFLPDGNKKKGLAALREAAKTAIFARAEAIYFLGNINFNYEHNYNKAVHYFNKLYQAYPNNNYYARLLVKNYCKIGRYDDAMQTIEVTLQRWEKHNLPFEKVLKEELYFWKGKIYMKRNKLKKAAKTFIKSFNLGAELARTNHRDYHAASAYYAGRALTKMGKKEEAASYYKAVLDSETGEKYKALIPENYAD